jgi:hypothetical protein
MPFTPNSTGVPVAPNLSALEERMTTVEGSVIGIGDDVAAAQAAQAAAEAAQAAAEQAATDAQAGLGPLTTRVADAEGNITTLQSNDTDQGNSISSLQSSVSNLTTTVGGKANTAYVDQQVATRATTGSVTTLNNTVAGHTTTLSDHTSRIGALEAGGGGGGGGVNLSTPLDLSQSAGDQTSVVSKVNQILTPGELGTGVKHALIGATRTRVQTVTSYLDGGGVPRYQITTANATPGIAAGDAFAIVSSRLDIPGLAGVHIAASGTSGATIRFADVVSPFYVPSSGTATVGANSSAITALSAVRGLQGQIAVVVTTTMYNAVGSTGTIVVSGTKGYEIDGTYSFTKAGNSGAGTNRLILEGTYFDVTRLYITSSAHPTPFIGDPEQTTYVQLYAANSIVAKRGADGQTIDAVGGTALGDWGGGKIVFDANSTAMPDGMTVWLPKGSNTVGRWLRVVNDDGFNVMWALQGIADATSGTVDVSSAVNAAQAAVNMRGYKHLFFPGKMGQKYRLSDIRVGLGTGNIVFGFRRTCAWVGEKGARPRLINNNSISGSDGRFLTTASAYGDDRPRVAGTTRASTKALRGKLEFQPSGAREVIFKPDAFPDFDAIASQLPFDTPVWINKGKDTGDANDEQYRYGCVRYVRGYIPAQRKVLLDKGIDFALDDQIFNSDACTAPVYTPDQLFGKESAEVILASIASSSTGSTFPSVGTGAVSRVEVFVDTVGAGSGGDTTLTLKRNSDSLTLATMAIPQNVGKNRRLIFTSGFNATSITGGTSLRVDCDGAGSHTGTAVVTVWTGTYTAPQEFPTGGRCWFNNPSASSLGDNWLYYLGVNPSSEQVRPLSFADISGSPAAIEFTTAVSGRVTAAYAIPRGSPPGSGASLVLELYDAEAAAVIATVTVANNVTANTRVNAASVPTTWFRNGRNLIWRKASGGTQTGIVDVYVGTTATTLTALTSQSGTGRTPTGSGWLASVEVTDPGANYVSGRTRAYIDGGRPINRARLNNPTISAGGVQAPTIAAFGSGYISQPQVLFLGDSSNAASVGHNPGAQTLPTMATGIAWIEGCGVTRYCRSIKDTDFSSQETTEQDYNPQLTVILDQQRGHHLRHFEIEQVPTATPSYKPIAIRSGHDMEIEDIKFIGTWAGGVDISEGSSNVRVIGIDQSEMTLDSTVANSGRAFSGWQARGTVVEDSFLAGGKINNQWMRKPYAATLTGSSGSLDMVLSDVTGSQIRIVNIQVKWAGSAPTLSGSGRQLTLSRIRGGTPTTIRLTNADNDYDVLLADSLDDQEILALTIFNTHATTDGTAPDILLNDTLRLSWDNGGTRTGRLEVLLTLRPNAFEQDAQGAMYPEGQSETWFRRCTAMAAAQFSELEESLPFAAFFSDHATALMIEDCTSYANAIVRTNVSLQTADFREQLAEPGFMENVTIIGGRHYCNDIHFRAWGGKHPRDTWLSEFYFGLRATTSVYNARTGTPRFRDTIMKRAAYEEVVVDLNLKYGFGTDFLDNGDGGSAGVFAIEDANGLGERVYAKPGQAFNFRSDRGILLGIETECTTFAPGDRGAIYLGVAMMNRSTQLYRNILSIYDDYTGSANMILSPTTPTGKLFDAAGGYGRYWEGDQEALIFAPDVFGDLTDITPTIRVKVCMLTDVV